MNARVIGTVLAVIIPTVSLLNAAVIPGRWEKVESLKEGTRIVVELKSGGQVEGTLKSVGSQDLRIIDLSGNDRHLPRKALLRILTTEKVRDGLSNGMLIGMGVGTGVSVGAVALGTRGISEECTVCGLAILVGFVGGWATGAAIDAIHRSPEVLYECAP